MTPLFNPRKHLWEEHFRWSRNWKKLTGRTAIGRATVVALDMNAKLLQQTRPYWRVVGLIPWQIGELFFFLTVTLPFYRGKYAKRLIHSLDAVTS
jgi:hypothetical protein